ncbi:carboxypepD_reg-like domain protein [Kordia sp. SMS9]|uniref:carboxypeptidase-like regulatory domain-containing protein n=1 Tax=Kordia sp. SMS9 TaxID=2282170 RepID=UPI000E106FFD|nr:carboxypeptidase-like regulatory domain-containing protein [Kordia sp. SMS9]AXG70201.1 carboxypepD_reg-like domain protein [Kordia sp. SMS9]
MRKTAIILITFLNLSVVFAQKNMAGIILDEETKQPVAYAHLIIPSEKRGTTADAEGNFEFTVPDEWLGKIVNISCVGFEDKKIELRQKKGLVIYLKPSLEFLSTVHITHTERQKRKRVNPFRGKQIIGFGNFSGGKYPSMLARYYPFIEKLGEENYLEEVTVFFYKDGRHDAKFRLRILSATADKMPKDDLLDPILVDVTYKQGRIKARMPANGIEVPREGFFVVVEHLFIKENVVEEIVNLQMNDSVRKQNVRLRRYAPIFTGIVEKAGESFSYYMSVNGWKKVEKLKMPKPNFKENEIVAPAFKVKLTN